MPGVGMLQTEHAETAGDILAELARHGETRTWEPGATVVDRKSVV